MYKKQRLEVDLSDRLSSRAEGSAGLVLAERKGNRRKVGRSQMACFLKAEVTPARSITVRVHGTHGDPGFSFTAQHNAPTTHIDSAHSSEALAS